MRTAFAFRDDTLDLFVEPKPVHRHPLSVKPTKDSPMPKDSPQYDARKHSLLTHAWTFTQMSSAITLLAKELPATSTIRQALTFFMIVERISLGQTPTMTEIKQASDKDKGGTDLIPDSMGRSYQVFLEPTPRDPDRLGWLALETDAADNRRKMLRLTKAGEAISLKIAKALEEKP